MMITPAECELGAPGRLAVDIGSTVIKVARITAAGQLDSQQFFKRDFERGIPDHIAEIMAQLGIDPQTEPILGCSSANGGLRVGVVCLSSHFSGAAFRNQVLLAGANPTFVQEFDHVHADPRRVDILLVGGGIDCPDAAPIRTRLAAFDPSGYCYGALVYAGNRYCADEFRQRFPAASVIANPLGDSISNRVGSVFEALRRAYLDDLVLKEGISGLPAGLARNIRPTPEVASRGFLRSVLNQSSFTIVGACAVLDIGGATTDLHYSVELVAEESPERPSSGVSVARYVFTDLGIVASRDTLVPQLRASPQLYEFLRAVLGAQVREVYAAVRAGEDEYAFSPELLAYGCLFLALERFAKGNGPGLPTANLDGIAQLILTGGAAQMLDEAVVKRLLRLVLSPTTPDPLVQVDRRYEIWVAGITWNEQQYA